MDREATPEMGNWTSVRFILLALGGVCLLIKILRMGRREKYLPPGPPTFPILGNVHLLPPTDVHLKFKEWSDKYGKIFSLKVFSGTYVVLNDPHAVHELLVKRGAVYNDRPTSYNIWLCLHDKSFSLMSANAKWKAQRKISAHMLSPIQLDDKVAPIQEAEMSQFLFDLLQTPADFVKHIRRTTSSVASIIIFGFRAPTFESFWASAMYECMEAKSSLSISINPESLISLNTSVAPGAAPPVEHFPVLTYIPSFLAKWKSRAKACWITQQRIWSEARDRVERRHQKGDERTSLADKILSGKLKSDVDLDYESQNIFFATLHLAATETTATMIWTNILFLARFPQFQEKARAELDRVCGRDRVPRWSDFEHLPYINCIVKEGLRIRPVVAAGLGNVAKQDDWYDGMLIPKGTVLFAPPYALGHTFYDKPDKYNPDRYLHHQKLAMDYAGSPDYMNRDHYGYGSGRRICAGIHLAERTQWRMISKLIWAFEILPHLDEKTGEVEQLDIDAYTNDTIALRPKPFKVRFVPRSDKHVEVIRNDFENSKFGLQKWEEE